MKVLFLDIDGVCNSEQTMTKDPSAHFPIDAYMAFLVGRIVMNTGCQVVLSSSWRHHPESVEQIEKRIVKILDKTPNLSLPRIRGDEIQAWLDQHGDEVTHYAILDDDSDMLDEQKKNFFQTTWKEGLTTEIAEKVIEHLNKKKR